MTQNSETHLTEKIKTDTNTIVSEDKKVQEIKNLVQNHEAKENTNEGEIIIKGKTDSTNDFKFHNVVNGDTLSDWYIKGNAEFVIKSRFKKSETHQTDSKVKESLNVVAQVARKSVAQSTIKEVAQTIKSKDTALKSIGFPIWIYFIAGGAVALLILLWWFFKK